MLGLVCHLSEEYHQAVQCLITSEMTLKKETLHERFLFIPLIVGFGTENIASHQPLVFRAIIYIFPKLMHSIIVKFEGKGFIGDQFGYTILI